jgi:phosphate transport system substrate-binding protein
MDMTRSHLLGAASAAALTFFSTAGVAQSVIQGGGASSEQYDYGNGAPQDTPGTTEFGLFDATSPSATFGTYWESGSGTGQLSFLSDNITCDISKAETGTATCTGSAGGANVVHYAASDSVLSATQVSSWATSSIGQSAAGNLIQIPSMGVAVAIVVNNPKEKKNYQIDLTDSDLCGVFSGLLTNFNQLSGFKKSKFSAGVINVVYRSDSAGVSYLLTNHLSDPKVCTASNTAPNFVFKVTSTFASLFTNNTPPANFVAANGNTAEEDILLGTDGPQPLAIGYINPDYTSVYGTTTLQVASITSGTAKKGQPTVKGLTLGLANPVDGQNLTPPNSQAQAANPVAWAPLIQTVKKGYPIVGYSTFEFAQCYSDPNVTASLLAFLNDHYTNSQYTAVQKANGFVSVSSSGAVKFLQALQKDILANTNGYNTNIGNPTACAGLAGR